ncbi:uncharacterized protein [Aegilops tauschii subsp. strangulata]|uniref:uncharacterized protein n=1 Tax=Aegilops tauschii subsp. strangulata TaxID=200361 RepID=UPI00098A4FD8|nr:proline-rich receptor-like protein kinase PERK2 [Aegilops tauschii subsp. strangulata]XP_044441156.1 proline-rich receptor-like protein kinase PERK2 [Triticum aestivum]
MALAARSSLRSPVLLVSHGRPQLSSFFSSSATARSVPPPIRGAATPPAAPAVQTPAPPDRSRPKQEETVLHPLPGVPRPCPRPPRAVKDVADKVYLNAPEDPSSAHPTPAQGSSSTLGPVFQIFEDPRHGLVDPPGRPPLRAVKSVAGKAYLDGPEDPTTHPAPDNGSCNASEPVSAGIFDEPRHPVPDPSARGRSAMTNGDEPAQCTEEHPKYPVPDSSTNEGPVEEHPACTTPGYGSCSTPEPVPEKPPCGTSEDVKQRDVDPPPPAREIVGHPFPDPRGRGRSALADEPEQCTQEPPKYPALDNSK